MSGNVQSGMYAQRRYAQSDHNLHQAHFGCATFLHSDNEPVDQTGVHMYAISCCSSLIRMELAHFSTNRVVHVDRR